MNKYIKSILVLLLIAVLNSCTDVVEVDVPDGGSRLVVEASIDWEKGTDGKQQIIKLGQSTVYFGEQKNKEVLGAKVSVFNDNNGMEIIFADQNNGEYKTANFTPKLNQSYTLKIEYKGEVYEAKETMISVTEINEVKQKTINIFGEDIIVVRAYFNDVPNVKNYYLNEFFIDDYPELEVQDDRLTDGNENNANYGSPELLSGDVFNMKLYGISSGYYNYMRLLIDQAGKGGGSPFSSTPAKLFGNCKNINNPDEEVLGYFRLCEYVEIDYTIE